MRTINTSARIVDTDSGSSFKEGGLLMIAYRGPMLIAEPELRWPIVLLAAAITIQLT